jgi:hypothetical protein
MKINSNLCGYQTGLYEFLKILREIHTILSDRILNEKREESHMNFCDQILELY